MTENRKDGGYSCPCCAEDRLTAALAERDAGIAELFEGLIFREARRLEVLDFLQDEIGTAWHCESCGHYTYHAFANECAECGAAFPLPNLLAFKLHAWATDNPEYINRARALIDNEGGSHGDG